MKSAPTYSRAAYHRHDIPPFGCVSGPRPYRRRLESQDERLGITEFAGQGHVGDTRDPPSQIPQRHVEARQRNVTQPSTTRPEAPRLQPSPPPAAADLGAATGPPFA